MSDAVTQEVSRAAAFGTRLREMRLAAGFGLQEFCRQAGLDAGNYSRMERGLKRPPRDHVKLEPIRRTLGLEQESDAWVYLLTLADLAWGLFPRRLLTDDEVRGKIIALLQRLHGPRVPDGQVEYLVRQAQGR